MKTAQERTLEVLHVFRTLNPDIEINHIEVFLQVAKQPGIDQQGLQKATELPQGTISRALKTLDVYLKHDPDNPIGRAQAGYGLIERRFLPFEGKKQFIHLSRKGTEILGQLEEALT